MSVNKLLNLSCNTLYVSMFNTLIKYEIVCIYKNVYGVLYIMLFNNDYLYYRLMHALFHIRTVIIQRDRYRPEG
jgi:hypothetical protein